MLQRSYTKWKSYRKEDGARKSFSKRKERAIGAMTSFWRERQWHGSVTRLLLHLGSGGVSEEGPCYRWPQWGWQENFKLLIKITFLVRVETAVRLFVSSWRIMASSISYAFWSLWFFLFNRGKKQKFKYVCPLLIWNISWGPQDSGNWPPLLTTLPPFSFSVSSWRLLAEGIYGNSLVHFEELLSFSGCHLCTQEVYMLYFQFFSC